MPRSETQTLGELEDDGSVTGRAQTTARRVGGHGRVNDRAQLTIRLHHTHQQHSKVKYTDIAVRSLTCHTAMGSHMPYGITQCYLPPDRGDIPPLPQPKLVLD